MGSSVFFFFFKQKTAYEMRISDWSSDVCSSDLCSATGVIRRHPDIKLTRQADDIAPLAALQGEMLDALWPTLDVGGILLYATCSVLPTENREVIGAFLERTPGARELDQIGRAHV